MTIHQTAGSIGQHKLTQSTAHADITFECISDRFEMPGFLVRPADNKPHPAVLFIYEAFA
jgi:hypothetical protein